MQTVFSHIVQKRLSQESENVATSAIEFILGYSEAARNGMMKFLRGVVPQLPPRLWFRTQQTEGSSRPDMWGNDDKGSPHVFIESKFWAGLTDNQPVEYLRILANQHHPTMLLVVVPEKREQTVWRELKRRVVDAGISVLEKDTSADIVRSTTTGIGPILALTSWETLFSFLGPELADDQVARGDVLQLRALCEAMESDAFVPFSSEEISDQRTPALILQLSSIWKAAADIAVDEGVLNLKGTSLQAGSERIGRYAYFGNEKSAGLWFGIHFGLWKKHGITPLWGVFSTSNWGRATEIRALLEPWAIEREVFVGSEPDGSFVVAFNVFFGMEKDQVVRGLADRLKEIGRELSVLEPRVTGDSEPKAEPAESGREGNA